MGSENIAASEAAKPEGDAAAAEPVTMSALAELLEPPKPADETKASEGAANENGEAGGNAENNAKPKMFNDLAESLDIKLDDLYKLEVTTTDGKTVTIEEMKTLQASQDDIAIRSLEFEESRAKKEGDLRQAQSELAEIVSGLPDGTLKPEVLEKLRAKNVARVTREQDRTLKAIPSWNDDKTRETDMVGMSTHLERFGFPANHLATVVDHKMLVFIRESFLREKRINNALERVRAGKPNPTTATKPAGKATAKPGAKAKNSNARKGLDAFFSTLK